MTYFGTDVDAENDPVKRNALETMIKTYGQTPRQLFTTPHPAKLKSTVEIEKNNEKNGEYPLCENIVGLKWGTWCGSPSLQEPKLILRKHFKPNNAVSVVAFGMSDCAVLPVGSVEKNKNETDCFHFVFLIFLYIAFCFAFSYAADRQ